MKLTKSKQLRNFIKKEGRSKQQIRSKLIKDTLKIWGKLIIRRDKICQWCSSKKQLSAHHIVARGITQSNKMAWFDIDNGMTLCFKCHILGVKHYPDEYIKIRDKFLNRKQIKYDEMRAKFRLKTKVTIDDIKLIQYCLNTRLELENE